MNFPCDKNLRFPRMKASVCSVIGLHFSLLGNMCHMGVTNRKKVGLGLPCNRNYGLYCIGGLSIPRDTARSKPCIECLKFTCRRRLQFTMHKLFQCKV